MKRTLLSILKTEQNRNPLLVGEEADFCNVNGDLVTRKVLKSLEVSENVIQNRCNKLGLRLSGADVTSEIQRKVKQPCSEFDQILAQYAQGSDQETHTETFERRLKEWEDLYKGVQEEIRKVDTGLSLQ